MFVIYVLTPPLFPSNRNIEMIGVAAYLNAKDDSGGNSVVALGIAPLPFLSPTACV